MEKQKRRKKMEKEALYALPVYGDILAASILQLARKNPGIAVADVERNLCGLKTKKEIKDVYYSGGSDYCHVVMFWR